MSVTENDVWWKALLVEFLGTFTLVFVGASVVAAAINGEGATGGVGLLAAAFAFGLALMTLIYVWGSYSGAHFNPAVSFGFAVAGQMNWGLMLGYWIAQILGAIAAAALVVYFFGNAGPSVGTATNTDAWKAILMEAFITFFLVIAYLFIYRNPMLAIVSGIVIGSVLTFATLVGGPISGGSTNPARSLGSGIFSNNMGSIWIYIIGPLLGALIAALVYKLFTANFGCCYKMDDCGKRIQDDCGNCILVCERTCLDKCGNPIKDECGKVLTEKVEVIERKHGHKQETFKKEAMEWMKKHGHDFKHLDKDGCNTCGDATVIVAEVKQVSVPISAPVPSVPVMTAPVITAPVMQTDVPVIQPLDNPVPQMPPVVRSTRSVDNGLAPRGSSVLPKGRTAVSVSPYSNPQY